VGGAATGGSTGLGGAPGGGGSTSTTGCQLHFEVTTVTYHGKYSPKNVGAIWIQTPQGKFIKSLNVWGKTRRVHLVKWNGLSGGNTVDAITAATATSHGAHGADWDCTDAGHQLVPDGAYQVGLEITEEDSAFLIWPPGPTHVVDFTKGSGPVSLQPASAANFVGMTLTVN
jgi:hypothetical protein